MTDDPLAEMDSEVEERIYNFQVIYSVEVSGTSIDDAVVNCATYFGEYGHKLLPDRIVLDVSKMFFSEL